MRGGRRDGGKRVRGRLRNCCLLGGRRVGGKRMRGRVGTIRELLPSGRTKRATLPMLPYMLPSGRSQRATFEATRTRNHAHAPPAFLYYVLKIDNQFLVRKFFDKYAFTAQKLRTNKRFLEISTSKSCYRLFGDLKIYGLIRCFRKPVRKRLVYIYFGSQKLRTKTDF